MLIKYLQFTQRTVRVVMASSGPRPLLHAGSLIFSYIYYINVPGNKCILSNTVHAAGLARLVIRGKTK